MDDINRKLLYHLSTGINSYEELAHLCNVSRNTVYKRVSELERQNIIKNIIRCSVNFDKLDITPLIIAAKIPTTEEDGVFKLLSKNPKIRFLWRAYGDHNLILLAFCPKGEEGKIIDDIKRILESAECADIDVSTGYVWEKSEISPFDLEKENVEILHDERLPKITSYKR